MEKVSNPLVRGKRLTIINDDDEMYLNTIVIAQINRLILSLITLSNKTTFVLIIYNVL